MENIKWSKEHMLEVILKEPDDFLKVKETLTRIGISSKNTLAMWSPASADMAEG